MSVPSSYAASYWTVSHRERPISTNAAEPPSRSATPLATSAVAKEPEAADQRHTDCTAHLASGVVDRCRDPGPALSERRAGHNTCHPAAAEIGHPRP